MSTFSNKLVVMCMVTAISMVIYGCGGGGSSSSSMMGEDDAMMCAEGQTGMHPNCMDPEPEPPRHDGPKTAMAIGAYTAAVNATDVVAADPDGTKAVSRAVDGTVTFQDGVDDTEEAPNSLSVSEEAAPGINGWQGFRIMKNNVAEDGNPQAGIVYTNIKAPMENKLMVDSLSPDTTDNLAVIMEEDGIASYSEEAEVQGTYQGIAGTFTCGSASCSIGRDDDDIINALSGWSFESTDNVDSLATQVNDYLYFGAWLETTPEDNANVFKAFAGGDTAYGGAITSVTGTATYTGAAAGLYATKENEIKTDGTVGPVDGSVMAGEFTAMARLTVNFAGTTLPADDHFTMTGAISDFMDGDQELGFQINLSTADPNGPTTPNTDFGDPMASGSHGTNPSTAASWSYAFHGVGTDNAQPTGISGVFNAHFANGHVAGGFGATQ